MRLLAIGLVLMSGQAFGKTYDDFKNEACPDAWSMNGNTIEVISSSTNPWGVETNDKSIAKSHLWASKPLITIDDDSITADALVDDELTVASECLEYRNHVVNGTRYYPPVPSVERNVSTGFIPASVF